ncbi:MAG: retroviral-like aspartic protease family protein [Candidatus Promineifilaceae bacterium]
MTYTHEYNESYPGPALPIVEIQVSALTKNTNVLLRRALIDSGADATMIPMRDLDEISARRVDRKRVRGVGGISYSVDIYEVSLSIGPFKIPKIYAVADRQNGEAILGRDVLNQFTTTLDGLAYMVHVTQ